MPLALPIGTLLLLLLLAAPALGQHECDCTLPLSLAGPAVCGANGITFQTRCLAVCQGVAIAAPGPCHSGKLAVSATASAVMALAPAALLALPCAQQPSPLPPLVCRHRTAGDQQEQQVP